MSNVLPSSFFERDPVQVARDLLGTTLVRSTDQGQIRSIIIETEAYLGIEDLASHARFGQTKRNEVMFGPAGVWYVYLCYGVHWLLNIVTEQKGIPSAVLIRAVNQVTGPGRLTKMFGVDKKFNAIRAEESGKLWIEAREKTITEVQIHSSARIGVEYAREWAHKPLRFTLVPPPEK